jgi:outer membrane protein assembly factor BamB
VRPGTMATMSPPLHRAAPLLAVVLAACGATASPAARPPAATPGTVLPAAATATAAWTTYHADGSRSGVDTTSPPLGVPRVLWRSPALDGDVYAEPLLAGGHVIVATEGDSLYSLDSRTGAVAWQAHLGTPVPRSQLACGNIFPLGITGTPVIDRASQLVYAVAETTPGIHSLVAVELGSGRVRWQRSVDPPGMSPLTEQQRAALALAGGRVYVAFGGLYGDCGAYHGWVTSAAADGTGPLLDYRVPSTREAGIWAPAGPVIDAAGSVFVSTGNSEAVSTLDGGDSVLRLSPDLHPLDQWAPVDWRVLNTTDADVGSISPAPVGGGLLFQGGKSGRGYLLRSDHLGGAGGEVFAAEVCTGGGAYGGTAFAAPMLYVPCTRGLRALRIGPGASFSVAWTGPATGPPILAGGAVWAIGAGQSTLYALDPATGAERATIEIGPTVHFATPASLGGLLVVGSGASIVAVTGV